MANCTWASATSGIVRPTWITGCYCGNGSWPIARQAIHCLPKPARWAWRRRNATTGPGAPIRCRPSGCHLGFLPEHFARPLAAEGLLRPLNEALLCYQPEIHLVTRKGAAGRDSIAAFIDDLTAAHAGAAAQD